MKKERNYWYRYKSFYQSKILRIKDKNKPRIFANTINGKDQGKKFSKSKRHYAIIEKMINVLHGLFKAKK